MHIKTFISCLQLYTRVICGVISSKLECTVNTHRKAVYLILLIIAHFYLFRFSPFCCSLIMHFIHCSFILIASSAFLHHSFMPFPSTDSSQTSLFSQSLTYLTACSQHSNLTHPPFPFFVFVTRPCCLCFCSSFVLAFLFLSGDIQSNPGPSSFTICSLHSLHPLDSAALCDLTDAYKPNLFCLTETWTRSTTTSAELLNCAHRITPYSILLVITLAMALPLVVALDFSFMNLSHSYLLFYQISLPLNSLL